MRMRFFAFAGKAGMHAPHRFFGARDLMHGLIICTLDLYR